jgi:hypothetical protein
MSNGLHTFLCLLHSSPYTLYNTFCALLNALSHITEYTSLRSRPCRDEYEDQTTRYGKQDFVRQFFYSH